MIGKAAVAILAIAVGVATAGSAEREGLAQPTVNRLAEKEGHGKAMAIESLGGEWTSKKEGTQGGGHFVSDLRFVGDRLTWKLTHIGSDGKVISTVERHIAVGAAKEGILFGVAVDGKDKDPKTASLPFAYQLVLEDGTLLLKDLAADSMIRFPELKGFYVRRKADR